MISKKKIFNITNEKSSEHKNIEKSNMEEEEDHKIEREKWGSKAEFLLSCVGLSVGIGNVWRFPHLAYKNGGGSFLIAYAIMLILVGKPLFYAELAIGQFTGCNSVQVWNCFPLAKGVGVAMVVMSTIIATYYNVIMTYTLYFMGQSFRSVLPWNDCYEWWGADNNCYIREANEVSCGEVLELLVKNYSTAEIYNSSTFKNIVNVSWGNETIFIPKSAYEKAFKECHNSTQTASEQFWERYVLDLSDGFSNIGNIKWDLALTLFVCWIIVFAGLAKGIKSTGKVVYFTATFPYVILIILVIYGCTLSGAMGGVEYFFVPVWSKLLEIEVWRAAAEQLLFSLSIGAGCLIMYSSYNSFENGIYKDALFISSLDFLTSVMSGVVIFSVLGHMSFLMKLDIKKVVRGGTGLAFVTYPEALARLPVPQLWSVLFFFMLFLLAIDSEFSYLENVFTVVFDAYPQLKKRQSLCIFISCMSFFLLGLPCVTQGGQYVINLMDNYGGGNAGLFIATFEIMAIMWGYGAENFSNDLELMLHTKVSLYWRICWKYVSPVILMFVVIYGMAVLPPLEYLKVPYPISGHIIAWIFMLVSVLQIPIWAGIQLYKYREDWRQVLEPSPMWGPSDPEVFKTYRLKYSESDVHSEKKGEINLAMDSVKTDDEQS